MSGYTKNIAVIRGLKEGFSADGGSLSGLVKAEKYANDLRVEASLINFAPPSEGRYVIALSDGTNSVLVENCLFEGASAVDTSQGFAAMVFFVNGIVSPVATAICGNFHTAAFGLRAFVERAEGLLAPPAEEKKQAAEKGSAKKTLPKYEDEAIAEVNYYEYAKVDESGGAVCENSQKETCGNAAGSDEAAVCAVEKERKAQPVGQKERGGGVNPLARGQAFYDKMKKEIEGILSAYPEEEPLCRLVDGSKWVRINYGDDKFYVFGVLYSEGTPQYICYGVPAKSSDRPPESMAGLAGFIPASPDGSAEGYWIMYQDAKTGAALHVDFE